MRERIRDAVARRLGLPPGSLSPIVVHAVLAVGIVFFEWDFVELILVYLSEIVIVAVLFAIVAMITPQPIDDHDADRWHDDPTPIQPVSVLPPVYKRNLGVIAENMITYAVFFAFFVGMFLSVVDRSVSALVSPATGLAVLAICVSQAIRVWREFLADRSYRDRSPAEALERGLRPVARFIIVAMYVVVPTTVVVVTAVFAAPEVLSRPVILLAYVLPIGAARVWLQNGAVESVLQHRE